jgi:predicted transcriptional regulator
VNTAEMIRRLLPQSIDWLVAKGYVIRINEDGEQGVRITEAGRKYLASIEAYRGNNHEEDVDKNNH